jgi:hypothetical protein
VTHDLDDRPLWEQQLSEADEDVVNEWESARDWAERDQERVRLGMPRRNCVNCKLEKTLRSSGRCYACEKYWQRKGEERPVELILKEIDRRP